MKPETPARFDPGSLKVLAGEKAFARGTAYLRNGSVELLDVTPRRVLARVAGTEMYRTVVEGEGASIGGERSCPAFADFGFCKHMVAVALAANAADTAGAPESAGTLPRIRSYLGTKNVASLVEMIVDAAERDPVLFRRLEIAAATVGADDKTVAARLRAAIRDATETRGFVDYGEAAEWASGVETVLESLEELAAGPSAARVVELADEAITRIERAIDDIDDSAGHCGALLFHAQRIHLNAGRAARPDPLALARNLFARETEGDFDVFDGAASQYEDILGEDGLAEYRRLAREAWDALPVRRGPLRGESQREAGEFRLVPILDFFSQRDGDLQARIDLRTKDLSSPWSYHQLAEFCMSHGRDDEALRFAEEGLWLFEDERVDERLVLFTVDLLRKADRQADAEALMWRAFEKTPSRSLYGNLRKLAGERSVGRAIDFLRSRLVGETATRWHFPADLLVTIMTEEKMFELAWGIVNEHGASRGVRHALAGASETTHVREALAVYEARVEELAGGGGSPAYEEASALIARMGALRPPAEQAAYVSGVKARHGRKRNLMKLLK